MPSDPAAPAEVVGRSGEEGQGPFYVITLKIADGVIRSASYRTYGCPWACKIGDKLTELATGKTPAEAFRLTEVEIDVEVGPIPRPKRHLPPMAIGALRDAVARATQLDG